MDGGNWGGEGGGRAERGKCCVLVMRLEKR